MLADGPERQERVKRWGGLADLGKAERVVADTVADTTSLAVHASDARRRSAQLIEELSFSNCYLV